MEEHVNLGIIKNIGTKSNLDYVVNLFELTHAYERDLLHSKKVQALICLQNLLFPHICLQGKHVAKSRQLTTISPMVLLLMNICRFYVKKYGKKNNINYERTKEKRKGRKQKKLQ